MLIPGTFYKNKKYNYLLALNENDFIHRKILLLKGTPFLVLNRKLKRKYYSEYYVSKVIYKNSIGYIRYSKQEIDNFKRV